MALNDPYPTDKEQWKVIPANNLYAVSDQGRVLHLKHDRLVNAWSDHNLYEYVELYKGGRSKVVPVHRLVAMFFVRDYDPRLKVEHIDSFRDNNRASNLCMGDVRVKATADFRFESDEY